MVHRRGVSSNQVRQLIELIQDWAAIIKSPPILNGKSFQWEPACEPLGTTQASMLNSSFKNFAFPGDSNKERRGAFTVECWSQ